VSGGTKVSKCIWSSHIRNVVVFLDNNHEFTIDGK